ncbi:MAG TPA: hypothetical protein VKE70_12480, partial [Candidatus Solibacter sp.]|nr:hypothetical protein [Candidatus Solibacter sp.]
LPKLMCPMCWPAYAGVVSALGLGFLISTKYLLPLTVAFLGITAAARGFRTSRRHGYGPLWLEAPHWPDYPARALASYQVQPTTSLGGSFPHW